MRMTLSDLVRDRSRECPECGLEYVSKVVEDAGSCHEGKVVVRYIHSRMNSCAVLEKGHDSPDWSKIQKR